MSLLILPSIYHKGLLALKDNCVFILSNTGSLLTIEQLDKCNIQTLEAQRVSINLETFTLSCETEFTKKGRFTILNYTFLPINLLSGYYTKFDLSYFGKVDSLQWIPYNLDEEHVIYNPDFLLLTSSTKLPIRKFRRYYRRYCKNLDQFFQLFQTLQEDLNCIKL